MAQPCLIKLLLFHIVPYSPSFLTPIANKAAPSKTLKIVLMSERRMSCSESGQSSRFFFNPQAGVHQTSLIQSIQYPPVSAIPTLKSRCQYFLDSQYGNPNVFNCFSSLQLLDSSNELHHQAIDQKSPFFSRLKSTPSKSDSPSAASSSWIQGCDHSLPTSLPKISVHCHRCPYLMYQGMVARSQNHFWPLVLERTCWVIEIVRFRNPTYSILFLCKSFEKPPKAYNATTDLPCQTVESTTKTDPMPLHKIESLSQSSAISTM